MKLNVTIPNIREQQKIGEFFKQLDFLIALHQRKPKYISKLT
ncbi:restriction endonuclease subunit S [Ligilactobacillus salivarius]